MGRIVRLVEAAAGEVLDVLGAPVIVRADPAMVGLLLIDHTVPPGYAVPRHVHDREDECFHVLSGVLTFDTPDGLREAGPGATALLPAGLPHGFRNAGPAPARCLIVVTPGDQAVAMFRALDRAAKAGPPAPEQVGAICAEHGVRFV
jgi:uncharacterized cupin superfamily protein